MSDYSKDFQISYDDERGSCTIRFRCFDTPNSVAVFDFGADWGTAEELLLAVRRACLEYHRLWSFTLPESDVSRLNVEAERVRVDKRTASLVQAMKDFSAQEPAFDFTVGPASYLWKHARSIPTDDQIAQVLAHVGASKVDVEGDVVVKHDTRAKIDVGGAAKGFVADAIVADLRAVGIVRADIDLGGNLYLMGDHPQRRPWRVSVRVPEGLDVQPPTIELIDASAVTSGSYERFVEIDGKRYQHIIDARTGWPCETDIVSATAISKSSLQADLLATTACIVGSSGLPSLASRHPDVRFVAIADSGTLLDFNTASWSRLL